MGKVGKYFARMNDKSSFMDGVRSARAKDAAKMRGLAPNANRRQRFFFKRGAAAASIQFTNGGDVGDLFESAEQIWENKASAISDLGDFDPDATDEAMIDAEAVDEADDDGAAMDEADEDEGEVDEAEFEEEDDEADEEA